MGADEYGVLLNVYQSEGPEWFKEWKVKVEASKKVIIVEDDAYGRSQNCKMEKEFIQSQQSVPYQVIYDIDQLDIVFDRSLKEIRTANATDWRRPLKMNPYNEPDAT